MQHVDANAETDDKEQNAHELDMNQPIDFLSWYRHKVITQR